MIYQCRWLPRSGRREILEKGVVRLGGGCRQQVGGVIDPGDGRIFISGGPGYADRPTEEGLLRDCIPHDAGAPQKDEDQAGEEERPDDGTGGPCNCGRQVRGV